MTWGTVELEAEVRGWLEGLSTEHFARAAFSIDLLAERGPLLGEPHTKQLDGKLRELRFWLDQDAMRISYWIATDRRSADGVSEVEGARDSRGRPGSQSLSPVCRGRARDG